MLRYWMTNGTVDLDVYVANDVDLDGSFDATCADTGEHLRINGWQIETLEQVRADGSFISAAELDGATERFLIADAGGWG